MAKPRGKSGSSSRRNPRTGKSTGPAGPDAGVQQQLQQIDDRLCQLTAEFTSLSGATSVGDSEGSGGMQLALNRQADLLHTLTSGLEQLGERLADRVVQSMTQLEPVRPLPPTSAEPEEPESNVEASEAPVVPVAETTPADESWAAIRRAMLQGIDDQPEVVDDAVVPPLPAEECAEPVICEITDPVVFEVPDPIDCAAITDEPLRESVTAMEEIMRQMASRLRQRIKLVAPITVDQLRELADELPSDFRERADISLRLLDEQLRLTELELSLERARVGRQMTRLDESRRVIRHTARQLGFTVLEDGTLEGGGEIKESHRTGRRWMRVLGFGR